MSIESNAAKRFGSTKRKWEGPRKTNYRNRSLVRIAGKTNSGQSPGFRWQKTGHRPQVAGHRPRVVGGRWKVAGCRPQATGRGPQVTGRGPQVTGRGSQVTGRGSQAAGCRWKVAGRMASGDGWLPGRKVASAEKVILEDDRSNPGRRPK